MQEHDIIQTYFAPLSNSIAGTFGLTDDAAALDIPAGHQLICTTDGLSEGVHFFTGDDPFQLAQKLMGVNLSDLAAMGATPLAYLLTLYLPRSTTARWLERFSEGLKESLTVYGGTLAGGDTITHNGSLSLSLTAMGTVPANTALTRKGAKAGDYIYVSGTVGDSYAGLQCLKNPDMPGLSERQRNSLIARYHVPTPRIELGLALRPVAHSCIDISDGLIADLNHICRQSKVGATLLLTSIPLSDAARAGMLPATDLITGGDDYELLFTLAPEQAALLPRLPELPLTHIGYITESDAYRVSLLDEQGQPIDLQRMGYSHCTQ